MQGKHPGAPQPYAKVRLRNAGFRMQKVNDVTHRWKGGATSSASRRDDLQVFTSGNGKDTATADAVFRVNPFQLSGQAVLADSIHSFKRPLHRSKPGTEQFYHAAGIERVVPLGIHLAAEGDIREVFRQPTVYGCLVSP